MTTMLAASAPAPFYYPISTIPASPRTSRTRPVPLPAALKLAPTPIYSYISMAPVRTPKARKAFSPVHMNTHVPYPTLQVHPCYADEDSPVRDTFAPPPLRRARTVALPPLSPRPAHKFSPRTAQFDAHVTRTARACAATLDALHFALADLAPHAPRLPHALSSLRASLAVVLDGLRTHARPASPALNGALGALCSLCEHACADPPRLGAFQPAFDAAAAQLAQLARELATPR